MGKGYEELIASLGEHCGERDPETPLDNPELVRQYLQHRSKHLLVLMSDNDLQALGRWLREALIMRQERGER